MNDIILLGHAEAKGGASEAFGLARIPRSGPAHQTAKEETMRANRDFCAGTYWLFFAGASAPSGIEPLPVSASIAGATEELAGAAQDHHQARVGAIRMPHYSSPESRRTRQDRALLLLEAGVSTAAVCVSPGRRPAGVGGRKPFVERHSVDRRVLAGRFQPFALEHSNATHAKEFDAIIQVLAEGGTITIERLVPPTGGHPVVWYVAC